MASEQILSRYQRVQSFSMMAAIPSKQSLARRLLRESKLECRFSIMLCHLIPRKVSLYHYDHHTIISCVLIIDFKKVNPVNPTFPPQAVTQQTYEFVRPDDGKGGPFRFKSKDLPDKPGTKEQITRYNCLLYLETCGRELPSSLNFDETHSNFVTADGIDINHYPSNLTAEMLATPQIMGSMCFRAEILFDGFLIPKFRPLVKETEIVIDSVSANANKKNEDLAFDWKYAFGGNTVHPKEDDVYFNMTRQTGTDDVWDKWFNNRVDGIKNTTGWRWVINEQLKQDSSVESDCWSWTAKRIWLKLTGMQFVASLTQSLVSNNVSSTISLQPAALSRHQSSSLHRCNNNGPTHERRSQLLVHRRRGSVSHAHRLPNHITDPSPC